METKVVGARLREERKESEHPTPAVATLPPARPDVPIFRIHASPADAQAKPDRGTDYADVPPETHKPGHGRRWLGVACFGIAGALVATVLLFDPSGPLGCRALGSQCSSAASEGRLFALEDTQPPTLSAVHVQAGTDDDSIHVEWTVADGSLLVASEVRYGTTPELGQTSATQLGTGEKEAVISSLAPGVYFLRVHAVDEFGQESDGPLQTLELRAPIDVPVALQVQVGEGSTVQVDLGGLRLPIKIGV